MVWKLAGRGKFTDVAETIDPSVPAKEELVKDCASCLAEQLATSMAEDSVEGAEADCIFGDWAAAGPETAEAPAMSSADASRVAAGVGGGAAPPWTDPSGQ